MKTEVEIRVMLLDTKEWAIASRPPEAGRCGKDPPLEPQGDSVSETVSCSVVSDSPTPWTAARQAPLSMGFSRQEHWSG